MKQIKIFKTESEKIINKFLSSHEGSDIVSYNPIVVKYEDGISNIEMPILTLSGSYVNMSFNDTEFHLENIIEIRSMNVHTFTFFKDRVMINDEFDLDFENKCIFYIGSKDIYSRLVDIDFNLELKYDKTPWNKYKTDHWETGEDWEQELKVFDFSLGLGFLIKILTEYLNFAPIEHYYAYNLRSKSIIRGSGIIANSINNTGHNIGQSIEYSGAIQSAATLFVDKWNRFSLSEIQ